MKLLSKQDNNFKVYQYFNSIRYDINDFNTLNFDYQPFVVLSNNNNIYNYCIH